MVEKNFKSYMTENEPVVEEKNYYVKGEKEPSLQYVIKHKGKTFLIWVPLEIQRDGQIKVLNSVRAAPKIFYIKKKPFAKGAESIADVEYRNVTAVFLADIWYNNRARNSTASYKKYDLVPVLDLFYKIAPQDVKEYNTNILFGSEKETKDVFMDLYNEL